MVPDPTAKSDILNRPFQSEFSEGRSSTNEEFQAKCNMGSSHDLPVLDSIQVSVKGVRKLLNLQPNDASGPDSISPRILRELATEVAAILIAIFVLCQHRSSPI